MSYIIAFVQFTPTGEIYPVECLRTDIEVGDEVLVQLLLTDLEVALARLRDELEAKKGIAHRPDRHVKRATVAMLAYLNWNCSGQIRAKVSEAVLEEDGYWTIHDVPAVVGFATNGVFVSELERLGWVPLKCRQTYRFGLTQSNQTASANILVRKNGIDLQMLPASRTALPQPLELPQESLTEGRVVRHFFAQTTFNLYEWVLQFAASFRADEGNYDRYFQPVGSKDKSIEAALRGGEEQPSFTSPG